jgi:hypothetical protein
MMPDLSPDSPPFQQQLLILETDVFSCISEIHGQWFLKSQVPKQYFSILVTSIMASKFVSGPVDVFQMDR